MEQLCVRWILRRWVSKCPKECQELRKLYAVVWRVLVMVDANISTTYRMNHIHVNSTTTDRPVSMSRQTVITSINQVNEIYFIRCKSEVHRIYLKVVIIHFIQSSPIIGMWCIAQTRTNAPRTTEDAVNMPPVQTYLTVSTAPVIMDTPVMDLPAQVIDRAYLWRDTCLHMIQLLHSFSFFGSL